MSSISNNLNVVTYEFMSKLVNFYLENQNLFKLMIKINQSPYALELFNRVNNDRASRGLDKMKICFISKEEAGENRAYRDANCSFAKGIITLRSDSTDSRLLSNLIFEIANLSQYDRKQKIEQELTNGTIKTAEELAKKVERLEFRTNEICNEIFVKSIENNYWDQSYKSEINDWNDFETFWKIGLQEGHVQYYMQAFDNIKQTETK